MIPERVTVLLATVDRFVTENHLWSSEPTPQETPPETLRASFSDMKSAFSGEVPVPLRELSFRVKEVTDSWAAWMQGGGPPTEAVRVALRSMMLARRLSSPPTWERPHAVHHLVSMNVSPHQICHSIYGESVTDPTGVTRYEGPLCSRGHMDITLFQRECADPGVLTADWVPQHHQRAMATWLTGKDETLTVETATPPALPTVEECLRRGVPIGQTATMCQVSLEQVTAIGAALGLTEAEPSQPTTPAPVPEESPPTASKKRRKVGPVADVAAPDPIHDTILMLLGDHPDASDEEIADLAKDALQSDVGVQRVVIARRNSSPA